MAEIRCHKCGRRWCEACAGTGRVPVTTNQVGVLNDGVCGYCESGWLPAEKTVRIQGDIFRSAETGLPLYRLRRVDIRLGTDAAVLCDHCREENDR